MLTDQFVNCPGYEAVGAAIAESRDSYLKLLREGEAALRRLATDQEVPWSAVIEFSMDHLGLSAEDMRRAALVAPSTVTRWRSGSAQPHALARETIGLRLADLVQARVSKLTAEAP